MNKKNLIFVTLLISVVLVMSFISAGWFSGKFISAEPGRGAITLIEGKNNFEGQEVSVGDINTDTDSATLSYRVDSGVVETKQISKGGKIQINGQNYFLAGANGKFLGKPEVDLVPVLDCNGAEYTLEEGKSQTISDSEFHISWISDNQATLSIDGSETNVLNRGDEFSFGDHNKGFISAIVSAGRRGIGKAVLCTPGDYGPSSGEGSSSGSEIQDALFDLNEKWFGLTMEEKLGALNHLWNLAYLKPSSSTFKKQGADDCPKCYGFHTCVGQVGNRKCVPSTNIPKEFLSAAA